MKGSLNLWLLVVVVVCALSFWFGRGLVWPERFGEDSERPALTRPAAAGRFTRAEDPESVHLVVLNGTPQAGLAREFGLLLGRAGCVAEQLGNAPHDHFEHSLLINRRLPEGRAGELAAELGGLQVLQEFDGRSAADAVLVLGRDAGQLREYLLRRDGS